MKQITTTINYLSQVETESGRVAQQFFPQVATRAVEPTAVRISVSDDRIATINITWGDRVERGEVPKIYGELADGTKYQTDRDGGLLLNGYAAVDETLLTAIIDARQQVADAWLAEIDSRPDVAAVVEDHRVVLDKIDRKYVQHRKQWDIDCKTIAQKFRRKFVQVGEQTVPGKHCVRGANGTLLGYADCWDGKWLGTVERVRR